MYEGEFIGKLYALLKQKWNWLIKKPLDKNTKTINFNLKVNMTFLNLSRQSIV